MKEISLIERQIPDDVSWIMNKISAHGYESYIVGGCVRDLLLVNREPKDWDLCTSALPEVIWDIFPDLAIDNTGIQYGTVTIMLHGCGYEITTYRKDGNYADGRRPDSVKYTDSLAEDLGRRDFTINAMAYNSKDGLIDLFGGQKDLESGIIRCVGEPEVRFEEDGLRILRAVRFVATYGFDLDNSTYMSMVDCKNNIKCVSKERITSELCKILTCGRDIKHVLMKCSCIMSEIIPQLEPCIGFNQNNKYHTHDVYEHMLYVVDYCKTDDFVIKLAGLLHDIGKPDVYWEDSDGAGHFYGHPVESVRVCETILRENLRLTVKQAKELLVLIEYHDMAIPLTKKSVKKALVKMGKETFYKWLILKEADRKDHTNYCAANERLYEVKGILESILEREECFSIKDLAVNGKDLIKVGYEPGKCLGSMLNELLEQVIDGRENSKDSLLKFAKARLENRK